MNFNDLKFNVSDRVIIKELLKFKSSELYYFHQKYLLSPAQLAKSIKKLSSINIISFKGDKLFLKDGAIELILKNKTAIFRTNKKEDWRKIPIEMLINKKE